MKVAHGDSPVPAVCGCRGPTIEEEGGVATTLIFSLQNRKIQQFYYTGLEIITKTKV